MEFWKKKVLTKEGKKQVNLWIDKDLLMKAKLKAVSNYMTFSAYIKKLIEDDNKDTLIPSQEVQDE